MTDIPDALVEKAAQALLTTPGDWPGPEREVEWAEYLMHRVLTAVLPDIARPVVDQDALAEVMHHEFAKRSGCRHEARPDSPMYDHKHCEDAADALLASGVMQDAADVRRAVAEETLRDAADAWDSEAELPHMKALADEHYQPGGPSMPVIWLRDRADRIAREIGDT